MNSIERWNSKQSDDTDRSNGYFTRPYTYWSDLGQNGKVNSQTNSNWRVLSQGNAQGVIDKPSGLTKATLDRLMKENKDQTAQLRAKYCKESRLIKERHVIATFAVNDDSEGLSSSREIENTMNLPISWWDDTSAIGQDGIKNALNQLISNQKGIICMDYYGESNSALDQFFEPTLLQRVT